MNAPTDKRTAADIEREGEQIRANLDQTLDEIQRKFSSAELLDRSVDFIRDSGGDFLREAAETVRRNPVPAILTAAGLIWLATSAVRSRSSGDSYSNTDYSPDYSRDTARSELDDLVQEQPLALGVLALAAGALIGAALPMSQYENKWVGPVHDRTLARAKEVSQREYDNLREAVVSSLERRRSNGSSHRPAQSR